MKKVLSIMLCLSIVLSLITVLNITASVSASTSDNEAIYNFTEGANWLKDTGNLNKDLSITYTPSTAITAGKNGNAFTLIKGDSPKRFDNIATKDLGSFSMVYSLKLESYGGWTVISDLGPADKGGAIGQQNKMRLGIEGNGTNKLRYEIHVGDGNSQRLASPETSRFYFEDKEYHTVVITYNNTTFEAAMYLDGVELDRITLSEANRDPLKKLYDAAIAGSKQYSTSVAWPLGYDDGVPHGALENYRIFGKALTAAEITAISTGYDNADMTAVNDVAADSLVHNFSMDGNDFKDLKGSAAGVGLSVNTTDIHPVNVSSAGGGAAKFNKKQGRTQLIADADILNSDEYTLETTVTLDDLSSVQFLFTVGEFEFYTNTGRHRNNIVWLVQSDGSVKYEMKNNNETKEIKSAAGLITAGTEYTLKVVQDKNVVTLYINDTQVATDNTWNRTPAFLFIGAEPVKMSIGSNFIWADGNNLEEGIKGVMEKFTITAKTFDANTAAYPATGIVSSINGSVGATGQGTWDESVAKEAVGTAMKIGDSGNAFGYKFEGVVPGVYKVAFYMTLESYKAGSQMRMQTRLIDGKTPNNIEFPNLQAWIDRRWTPEVISEYTTAGGSNKIILVAVINVPDYYNLEVGFWQDKDAYKGTLDKVVLATADYDFGEDEYLLVNVEESYGYNIFNEDSARAMLAAKNSWEYSDRTIDNPVLVDKDILNASILAAETALSAAVEGYAKGNTMPGAKAIFGAAINAAKAVANNNIALQSEVDAANTALIAAKAVFDAAKQKADKTELASAIAELEAILSGLNIGTGPKQYSQELKDEIQELLAEAKGILNDKEATEEEIDYILSELEVAILMSPYCTNEFVEIMVQFEALMEKIDEYLENADDYDADAIAKLDEAYFDIVMAFLETVFEAMIEGGEMDIELLRTLLNSLQEALDEFESTLLAGTDKEALNAAITEAEALYKAAVEGTAKGQYKAGSKAKLQAAIDAAKAVADDEDATQEEIDAALEALLAAIEEFEDAKVNDNPKTGDMIPQTVVALMGISGIGTVAILRKKRLV